MSATVKELESVLREVLDPETSYSMLEMGFLKRVEVKDDQATIVVSPPTYWCPPALLYMMLEDLRGKLCVKGYKAKIVVEDHHDAEKITGAINSGLSFEECYGAEALGTHYAELKKKLLDKQEKRLRGGRENRHVALSLSVNGELCMLVGEARRLREGAENTRVQ